jgi:hypothetical protein
MDLFGQAIQTIHNDTNPAMSAAQLAENAFRNAVWAEGRMYDLEQSRDQRGDVRELARMRDAFLTTVAEATGRSSQVWLDRVRAITVDLKRVA